MDERAQIEQLYRQYWQYMIERNAEGLRGIMAEDYTLRHMTGLRQSREAFLRGLLDGTFCYYGAAHDSIAVQVEGGTAKLTGESRVTAAVYGGDKRRWRLRSVFSLRRDGGVWRLTDCAVSTF